MKTQSRTLTAREGRRFGLTVGGAFLVIAAITWWRDHQTAMMILGGIGTTLGMAGLLIPTRLGPIERAWMGLAHAISKITTPIVMGAMYALVISPMGALRRRFGGNPLVHAAERESYWHARPEGSRRTRSLHRQF